MDIIDEFERHCTSLVNECVILKHLKRLRERPARQCASPVPVSSALLIGLCAGVIAARVACTCVSSFESGRDDDDKDGR